MRIIRFALYICFLFVLLMCWPALAEPTDTGYDICYADFNTVFIKLFCGVFFTLKNICFIFTQNRVESKSVL